jgi:hypothetical protein
VIAAVGASWHGAVVAAMIFVTPNPETQNGRKHSFSVDTPLMLR